MNWAILPGGEATRPIPRGQQHARCVTEASSIQLQVISAPIRPVFSQLMCPSSARLNHHSSLLSCCDVLVHPSARGIFLVTCRALYKSRVCRRQPPPVWVALRPFALRGLSRVE
eukprot:5337910-Alexandrium_andersonii.AAC.1